MIRSEGYEDLGEVTGQLGLLVRKSKQPVLDGEINQSLQLPHYPGGQFPLGQDQDSDLGGGRALHSLGALRSEEYHRVKPFLLR